VRRHRSRSTDPADLKDLDLDPICSFSSHQTSSPSANETFSAKETASPWKEASTRTAKPASSAHTAYAEAGEHLEPGEGEGKRRGGRWGEGGEGEEAHEDGVYSGHRVYFGGEKGGSGVYFGSPILTVSADSEVPGQGT
jgi:hypothetical protein